MLSFFSRKKAVIRYVKCERKIVGKIFAFNVA